MANKSIQKVFVVTGNDFPDAVFSTEKRAEAYCEFRRKEGRMLDPSSIRIYWRVYSFDLDKFGQP